MIKNRKLCEVARKITRKRPNIDAVAGVFKSHRYFSQKRAITLSFYTQKASTIATTRNLTEAAQDLEANQTTLE